MNKKIKIIEKYSRSMTSDQPGHDFGHIDRVRHWSLKIAKAEKYPDLVKVEAAALLHDIAVFSVKNKKDHGKKGSEMARKFLTKNKLFSPEEIDEICEIVLMHCEKNKKPGQLLKIIQDADMLDSLGLMGMLRASRFKLEQKLFDIKNPKSKTWGFSNDDFDNFKDFKYVVDTFNYQISFKDNLKTKFAKKQAKHLVKIHRDMVRELEKEVKMCYY